jgi:NAD(P)-dependent dehydrogenase (short-subunit alcohol dehydrogenase family)
MNLFKKVEQSLSVQSHQPGKQAPMVPEPKGFMEYYKSAGKLIDKVAIISGGDSGIGRATAIGFAKEGANVAIIYLEEDKDALITKKHVEAAGRHCLLIKGDIGNPQFCKDAVKQTLKEFKKLNIVVNNAGEQHVQKEFINITPEQLQHTFQTNIFGMFYLTQAALPHLHEGDAVINTASITAYRGHETLIDYSATKGAIVTFTRSLSKSLAKMGIRVNAVAPGPIWTPLIPSSFGPLELANFGANTTLGRPGQPDEVAPSFIFLACDDSSYMTGQVLHPNGGEVVNG